jgi:hypothetical protein
MSQGNAWKYDGVDRKKDLKSAAEQEGTWSISQLNGLTVDEMRDWIYD